MMNGKLEEHLQTIEDNIKIEDKIVTYKFISKILKVHTNTAKQLLFAFSKKPEANDKLLVTYIVSGELQDGDGLCFRLVQESDLEETKKKFHRITSVHVYSIQRGTTVSGAEIYNAEKSYELTSEDHIFRSIQPGEEIQRREIKVVPIAQAPNGTSSSKKSSTDAHTSKPSSKCPEPSTAKGVSSNKTESKSEPINGAKKASPKKTDKKPAPTKGGGIGALFMKQTAKHNEDLAAKADKEKENIATFKTVSKEEKNETANSKDTKSVDKDVKTPINKSKSQSKKKRKKPKDSKDSTAKRRKRIQNVSSDSENDSNEESDGDERYPSPEPEPEPEAPVAIESEEEEDIIPATPLEKGRKRVRKLVDRTFEDDEGYIITRKEYVFESCSDDESGEPPKKQVEVETTKEKVVEAYVKNVECTPKEPSPLAPAKVQKAKIENTANKTGIKPGRPPKTKPNTTTGTIQKQASITNFFKKK